MTRQFQKRADVSPSAVPASDVKALVRSTTNAPAKYTFTGGELVSCCVNCADKPCLKFTSAELPANAPPHAQRVCPTDAIQYSDRERRVVVTDACIGCNLCVLRCPVGAIFVEKNGKANTLPFNADGYKDAPVTETSALLKLPTTIAVPRAEEGSAIRRSITMQRGTDKAEFYPLTGSLLTSIGLYTVVSRAGDTNNRMDAVVVDKVESMPAEIKSPGEVEYINVKAVRQAVENKVVMTARKMFPTTKDTSTLAIGYSYANDRSDVEELVEDIAKTFGINVGLVSIEVLYILVWNRYIKGDKAAALALRRLKGRAHAAIS